MFRCCVDSEYKLLRRVLLCKPHPKISDISNPRDVLHLKKIDYKGMQKEYEEIIKLYMKFKIDTLFIKPGETEDNNEKYVFNIMFTRDHFLMTPRGAIMARMFSDIRSGEVKYAEKAVRVANVRIRKFIQGCGTFEGADALWVNGRLVIVGVGNRTNTEGFRQIKEELEGDGIECVRVPAPHNTIHLLGALQFVDSELALVRADLIRPEIISLLKKNKIRTISLPENSEIREKQAMNFVTIAPRKIIMPADCPRTKIIYEKYNIKIAAEVRIKQLIKGGGGLACATGILAR